LLGAQLIPSLAAPKRALQINVLHVSDLTDAARYSVKSDANSDAKVCKTASDVSAELEKALQSSKASGAVTLIVEFARVWSISVHVPLPLTGKADDDAATLALCQDSRRIIVARRTQAMVVLG
jgi:hypothetical protein